jgi:hypothetical protein
VDSSQWILADLSPFQRSVVLCVIIGLDKYFLAQSRVLAGMSDYSADGGAKGAGEEAGCTEINSTYSICN